MEFNTLVKSNASMGADITSNSVNISESLHVAYHAVWDSGTSPVGTLTLQGSNDDSNYSDIASSSYSLSGNSGNIVMNIPNCAFVFARVKFTRTSGTATMTSIRISAKK